MIESCIILTQENTLKPPKTKVIPTKRNPLVVPVMKKGVRKHKNRKRDSIINPKEKEENHA